MLKLFWSLLFVIVILTCASVGLKAQEVCDTTLWVTCCNSELPYQYHGQSFSQSGTYDVHLAAINGCDSVVHLNLTVVANPNLSVSGVLSFCDGESTTLVVSGGLSYLWEKSFGPTYWYPFSNGAAVTLTEGGNYMVTATDAYGCTASQQVSVTKKNLPNVFIFSSADEVCEGTAVQLSTYLSSGSTCLWSTGSTERQITVTTGDTYYLQVSANGCTAVDSAIITVHPTPVINFVGQDGLCQGDTATLYAISPSIATYLWNTNETDSAIRVHESGVYSVAVQSIYGCVNEDSVTVMEQALPTVVISGPDVACAGTEVTLTASGTAVGYSWSTGALTAELIIQPSMSASYQVTAYSDHACTSTATAYVFVNEVYDTTIAVTRCSSELPYVYHGVPYTQSGNYNVHLTSVQGCDSLVHLQLTVLDGPYTAISGETVMCQGDTTLLYAVSNTGFSWSTGETYSPISVSDTGWYVLTATASNGCHSYDSVYVAYRPDMGLTVSGDYSFCDGQSTSLTVSGGESYVWEKSFGPSFWFQFSTDAEVILSDGGDYRVTATDSFGCKATQIINVIKKNLPNASIFTNDYDHEVCEGNRVQLSTGWSSGYSYLWSNGSTERQISVYKSGTYVLQVTSNGCTGIDSIYISMYPLPEINFSGDTLICRNYPATVYASAPDAVSYLWNTGDTVNSIHLAPAEDTVCWVSVENMYGCVKRDTVLVKVEDAIQAVILGPDSICVGDSAVLLVSGGVSYLWDNDSTTAERIVNVPGTYSVTVITAGGCSASAQKNIAYYEAPDTRIVGHSHICSGDSVLLTAPGLVSCMWSDSSTANSIVIYDAGVYWVEGRDAHACFARDTVEVGLGTPPTVWITGDSTGCYGGLNVLTANSSTAVSFLWSNGETTAQIQVNETAMYAVLVNDSNFCHAVDSFYFEVRPSPPCSILGNTEICQGDFTVLTASDGDNFLWSTGDTTSSIQVSPENTQSYTLTVRHLNGCSSYDSVQVVVHSQTPIAIQGGDTFCEGDSVLLVAAAEGPVVWSTGHQGDSIWVKETGDYTVWSLDSNSCQGSSTKHVEQYQMSNLQIMGEPYLCMGDTGMLYVVVDEPVTYLWSNGSTDSAIHVTYTNLYSVTVTNASGCTATASKLLMVYSAPTIAVNGPTTACYADSVQLVASGTAIHYHWSTGDTTASVIIRPRFTDTYQVTGSNDYGCIATASISVTVLPIPAVSISGDTVLCQGEASILTCTNASSFLWSTGATERSISVSETGNYSVVATNSMGCTQSASIYVHVYELPNLMILGDTVLCQGEQTELLAIGGNSYLWSNGSTSASITLAPDQSAIYTVQAFNGECMSEMSRQVIVNEKPTAIISAPGGICEGSSALLTAQGGLAYIWSNGQTSAMIDVYASGLYQVVAYNQFGCTDTAIHNLIQYPHPQVSIIGLSALCQNEQGSLTAIGEGAFLWSTGDTSSSITINLPGYYQVQMTDPNGCVASASQNVSSLSSPTVIINGANDMCENDTISLSVLCANASSFSWNTGEISTVIEVSPSVTTSYTVTAISPDNCITQQSYTVNVHPAYQIEVFAEICQGHPYSGQGFIIPVQQEAGLFTFTRNLQTAYGCDSVRVLQLTVNPVPVITGSISGNGIVSTPGNYVYMIDPVENATSYEWILSNPNWSLSYNQTIAQVSILYPGSATLSVYALNSCGQSLPMTIQITYSTGVDDVEMSAVQVFPNPTTGVVNVQCVNHEMMDKSEIQLFDMYGRLLDVVETNASSSQPFQIDLSSYASGIYLLKLRNSQNAIESTVKIVKQ